MNVEVVYRVIGFDGGMKAELVLDNLHYTTELVEIGSRTYVKVVVEALPAEIVSVDI